MQILFVHPNFPAQFRSIAPRLATDYGWTSAFAAQHSDGSMPGVRRVDYRPAGGAGQNSQFCTRTYENAIGHAHGVYNALKACPDVRPDLIVAHSGFGSSLFLPYLYDAPIINFFEYFYHPTGQDLGYRPEMPVTELHLLRNRSRNAMILSDLSNCDRGWSPNEYQRGLFPPEYREKIEVIPEGIDVELYRRGSLDVKLDLGNGTRLPPDTRVVTYVSRGFELMRGFDVFLRAAKLIQERFSNVVFVVVGSDRSFYGSDEQFVKEKSLARHAVRESGIDLSRFCFPGHVPEHTLAQLLSISDVHIYLTVPFVPSWSLLNAMSCSCVVVASDQACTREYITHGHNGLLCDFFDAEGIADQAVSVLKDPAAHRPLGEAARRAIEERYSLEVTLPRIKAFFERVAAGGPRRPSVIAERLIRPGTLGVTAASEDRPGPRVVSEKRRRRTLGPRRGPVVLFCWELGRGLGHMLPMLPLAEGLRKRGCRVMVALRTLSAKSAEVFGRAGIEFLQAPVRIEGARPFPRTVNLAHILADCGWGDDRELFVLGCAWRNLMRQVDPDLVAFDYSPTAMLAARSVPSARTVVTGLGFFCPPDVFPLPTLIEGAGPAEVAKAAEDERYVLAAANRLLGQWKARPLERLGQLFGEAGETFLQTFAELDHYVDHRPAGTEYWGPIVSEGGTAPQWPQSRTGRRVYAYLKNCGALPAVLKTLAERGDAVLVFADGIDGATRKKFASPTLRFETERLDMAAVGRECDAALHNANHGTLARLLLAGRPMVQLPLTLEQTILARAVDRTGAAETVAAGGKDAAGELSGKLDAVLGDDRYATAARTFAAKYADFDPAAQVARMVGRVEELISTAKRREGGATLARASNVPAGVFRA